MQRTLLLIRHAKSSWANPMQSDFERELNDRGEHDAPLMGGILKKKEIQPDLIISSPAKRAKQTARKIAGELPYDKDAILYNHDLYHCEPDMFRNLAVRLDDKLATVFIVAHNPGITEFVNTMSDKFRIDNVPTCGIVGIRMDAEHWSDFNLTSKEVFLYEYPKKYYDGK